MKTIGLLGGMTAESSAEYYKLINIFAREKMGGNHSAKSVMISVDFGEMEPLMESGEWEKLKGEMSKTALSIEKGGADFLVICTNTIHKFADHIENIEMDELSMGMTGDFEVAIREGATLVRIGTAIFGDRM